MLMSKLKHINELCPNNPNQSIIFSTPNFDQLLRKDEQNVATAFDNMPQNQFHALTESEATSRENVSVNSLLHEFCFPLIFEIYLRQAHIVVYRLINTLLPSAAYMRWSAKILILI